MHRKIFTMLFIIMLLPAYLLSQENTAPARPASDTAARSQATAPSTTQAASTAPSAAASTSESEIEALRRREQLLRQREEMIRQREEAIRRRENNRIIDRTNLERELRAREERRRLRAKQKRTENLNYKYSVGIFGGITYLLNPNSLDYSSNSKLGGNFGLTFLYAIDDTYQIKVGADLVYATMLSKFEVTNPTFVQTVKNSGFFLMLHARYEFLKRKDGEMFIPWAGVSLGLLFPRQSGSEYNKTMTIAYGLAAGFDVYFTDRISLGLQLKFYGAKYNLVPDYYPYCKSKTLVFFMPSIGVTISF